MATQADVQQRAGSRREAAAPDRKQPRASGPLIWRSKRRISALKPSGPGREDPPGDTEPKQDPPGLCTPRDPGHPGPGGVSHAPDGANTRVEGAVRVPVRVRPAPAGSTKKQRCSRTMSPVRGTSAGPHAPATCGAPHTRTLRGQRQKLRRSLQRTRVRVCGAVRGPASLPWPRCRSQSRLVCPPLSEEEQRTSPLLKMVPVAADVCGRAPLIGWWAGPGEGAGP